MFYGDRYFNQSLTHWDTSHVTNMADMFYDNEILNSPLFNDTSSVTNMYYMFDYCLVFNQPIGNWDVSHVTDMSQMFYEANSFNQSLASWNTSSVTNMNNMFYDDAAFNQPLNSWDVSHVTDMSYMFSGGSYALVFNQPLNSWNVSSVTNFAGTFSYDLAFNQNLGSWNVSNATNFNSMFYGDKLSYPNYDSLLMNWSLEPLHTGMSFSAGNSQYSYKAINARNTLTTTFGWTITDGGETVLTAPQNIQSQVSNETVILTWSAPYSDGGYPIYEYVVYSSTISGSGYNILGYTGPSYTNYTKSGLTNGQTYYFMIGVINTNGTFVNSTQVSAIPAVVPSAPLSLQVQFGIGFASLSWSTPASNGGSNITGYNIYSSFTNGTGFTFIGTVNATTFSFNDTGLTNGQTYYFIVTANNSQGTSAYSSEVFAIIPTVPSAPLSLHSQTGNEYAFIMWSVPSYNGGLAITSYTIYRSNTTGTGYVILSIVSASTYSYNDTGLTKGQTYYYMVSANNTIGEGTNSTEINAQIPTMPSAPQSVQTHPGNGFIFLTWSVPTNNGGSNVTSYNIYHTTTSGSGYILLGTSTTLSYNDTGLTNGHTYYYIVSATNIAGTGVNSTEVNDIPATVPSVPQSLQAQTGNAYISLLWTAPTSTGGSAITGYNIYRSTTNDSNFVLVKSLGANSFSYTDNGLTNGQEYYYVVTSTNKAGESAYSNEISASPSGPVVTSTNSTTLVSSSNSTNTASSLLISSTPGYTAISTILALAASTGLAILITRRKRKLL